MVFRVDSLRFDFDAFFLQFSGTKGINWCNPAVICFYYSRNQVETVYRVDICPRGNLPYI